MVGMASSITRRSLSLSLAYGGPWLHLQAQPKRQVAITIDDIPRGGDKPGARDFTSVEAMTKKLVSNLNGSPAIAFVNPGRAKEMSSEELQRILKIWTAGGVEIGNHTNTHVDIHSVSLAEYQADVLAAEPALQAARGGRRCEYFRHPYLRAGQNEEVRSGMARFLAQQKYTVAPVTVDTADYIYAAVYTREGSAVIPKYLEHLESAFAFFEKRSTEVLGREIAQTLLIHANQLNADAMPQILAMLARRGYTVVSLAKALEDPLYQTKENYAGKQGMSWIHRWGLAKNMKIVWEPETPPAIMEAFKRHTATKL
jgi:peptidoglycan/xylan/chitin deacetylase (PgdA/CDA1 family)